MEEKKDEIIICKDCKKEFTFSVGEQKFYEEKGFAKPIRCKECREKRKAERENKENNSLDDLLEKFKANTVKIEK